MYPLLEDWSMDEYPQTTAKTPAETTNEVVKPEPIRPRVAELTQKCPLCTEPHKFPENEKFTKFWTCVQCDVTVCHGCCKAKKSESEKQSMIVDYVCFKCSGDPIKVYVPPNYYMTRSRLPRIAKNQRIPCNICKVGFAKDSTPPKIIPCNTIGCRRYICLMCQDAYNGKCNDCLMHNSVA